MYDQPSPRRVVIHFLNLRKRIGPLSNLVNSFILCLENRQMFAEAGVKDAAKTGRVALIMPDDPSELTFCPGCFLLVKN
jgi:hypothetical protein